MERFLRHRDKSPHCYTKNISLKQLKKNFFSLSDGTVAGFACNYGRGHCEPLESTSVYFIDNVKGGAGCAAASKNHILIPPDFI